MLFENDRSRSALAFWCEQVASMKAGEYLDAYIDDIRDIATFTHNEAKFTAPDRIMGNIIGSAYTHSYRMSDDGRKITFIRHENTGERRHSDPDDEYRISRLRR